MSIDPSFEKQPHAKGVKMAKTCGAKTRSGAPCKGKAMPNGRCRMHGGTSKGAPKGNSNAVTHGIYSRKLTDEELETSASIELGNIDNELKLVRIRLMRIIENERKADGSPELVEVANFEGGGANATSEYRKSQVLDYLAAIDRLTARIASMELTRIYLMKAGADGGGDNLPESKMFTYVVADDLDGDANTK